VVKALRHKSEGPAIDSRCRRFFFPWHLTVQCALGSTQPLKNEYQVNLGGKDCRCVRLTTYHLHVPMSRNLGTLTSWDPVGKGGRCVRLTPYHLHLPMSRNLGALTYWDPVGKGGRCVRLTPYHLHVLMSRNLGDLTSWDPVGKGGRCVRLTHYHLVPM
jgi:hypothetical protein